MSMRLQTKGENHMYGRERTMLPAPARKRRRTCAPPVPVPELPVCVLLEIAARTDAATIFRCAATCRLLRREILSADFVRRVCRGPDAVVPSMTTCALGETFSVVHPRTSATAAMETHFAQAAAGVLLQRYEPLRSRDGLVVLRQRGLGLSSERRCAELCVYDPMANSRAFLPFAPGIDRRQCSGGAHSIDQCALLTAAADGIGCAFMLVAADMARNSDADGCASSPSSSVRVRVQTASAGAAGWGPVKTVDRHPCPRWCTNMDARSDAAVVVGGVVHWLVHCGMSSSAYLKEGAVGEHILTYDVNAATVGSVDVPMDRRLPDLQREPALPSLLAASPDGKKLSFVVVDHCTTVFVWVLSGRGGSWARRTQIDVRAVWGPPLEPWKWMHCRVEMESFSGDRRSGGVFLRYGGAHFVLDVGTGATCVTRLGGETGIPYEIDLASRLASMRSF